ncbi:MAG: hypothetical protein KDJ77_17140 [Rhodobiaceae bacterium]|nr:hypothetical protein [Rhodobiaceae bacterium]
MGYRIFMRCLSQVLRNWLAALKLSWVWCLVAFAMLLVLVAGRLGIGFSWNDTALATKILLAVIAIVLLVVGFAFVAIGWHRYVLREEAIGGFFVVRSGWPARTYILRWLRIIFIIFLFAIPIAVGAELVSGIFERMFGYSEYGRIALWMAPVWAFVAQTVSNWAILRIGLGLPAIAVDGDISVSESFRITQVYAGQLVVTAMLIALLGFVPDLLMAATDFAPPDMAWPSVIVVTIVGLAFYWIGGFAAIGILTVLYGHLVEKRPI